MKKTMIKAAALAVMFLFFNALNAKAQNDFNLNSMTASDIVRFDELNHKGVFDWIKPSNELDEKIEKEWTIMVFMNAKNNMEKYGLKDVNEMEMVGSSDKVNIIVELGRIKKYSISNGNWKEARRYYIEKDANPNEITSPVVKEFINVNMGNWRRLASFGKWVKKNYPAKHYMLIVWGHGSGWEKTDKSMPDKGLSYDYETGKHFTTPELGRAIEKIGKLDIYGSDACLMQMASVVYEIKDNITYIIGSEDTEYHDGYAYNDFLSPLISNPFITPAELSKVIVDAASDHYVSTEKDSTQSVVKTSSLANFLTLLNDFTYTVIRNVSKETVKSAISKAQDFFMPDNKDLYHFVSLLIKETDNAAVKEKGEALMKNIKTSLVVHNRDVNTLELYWGLPSYSNAFGISVYLPEDSYDKDYGELKWAKDSNWDEFIEWYLTE